MVYTEYISEEYHKNSKLVIITFKIKCFIFYLHLRNSFEENCKSFKRTFSPNLSTITSYLNSTEFGILFCPNAIATTDWRTFGCFPSSRGNTYITQTSKCFAEKWKHCSISRPRNVEKGLNICCPHFSTVLQQG